MRIICMSSEFDNGTPARVHRPTGTVELAPSFFRLSPDQRHFVLLHELGHYALNTRSEQEADAWAADNMQREVGLKRTFRAMNGALHESAQNDRRRIDLYNRLVRYDNETNGNDMKTIGPCVYMPDSDTMQQYQVQSFEDNGFTFNNNFIPSNINAPAYPVEASEFIAWCGFVGKPYNLNSLAQYRKAKAKAWSNYQDLGNGFSIGYDPNAGEVKGITGGRDLIGPDGKPIIGNGNGQPQLESDTVPDSQPDKGRFGMLLFLAAIAAVAYIIYKN